MFFDMLQYISMNIEKTISPFAQDVSFTDVDTLVAAFSQKALAEGWTEEEVKYVTSLVSGMKLDSALSTILDYVEASGNDDDDQWDPFADNDEDDEWDLDRDRDYDSETEEDL
jgi:hypothetical protein